MFHLVQPYTDGPDRGSQATIVSTHETIEAAYAALDAIADQLESHQLAGDVLDLLIVDENRRPVLRPRLQ
jgi:hypothetical protein